MINRRNFVKLLLAAPAVKAIDVVSSNKSTEENKSPKAILVDPWQVNMRDITHHTGSPTYWPDEGIKIIRKRKPAWGKGEPIMKIF